MPLEADPAREVHDGAHDHIFDGALVVDLACAVQLVDYVRKRLLIEIDVLVDTALVEDRVGTVVGVLAIQSLQHGQESGFCLIRLGRHLLDRLGVLPRVFDREWRLGRQLRCADSNRLLAGRV